MKIYENIDISKLSNWKVGGICRYFIIANDIAELHDAIGIAKKESLNYLVVGKTTNLLFCDDELEGVVIALGKNFGKMTISGDSLYAGASCYVPNLVRTAINHKLSGLEHLIGVPASLGGAVYMNAGSQRKSISDCIEYVDVWNATKGCYSLDVEQCDFGYRSSIFQSKKSLLIIGVKLNLEFSLTHEMRSDCLSILRLRNKKFPRKLPSCGSVFKSSPELYNQLGPPGAVIESLGLKGISRGGAQISPLHANFIVNNGGATAKDILYLVSLIREKSKSVNGIDLIPEFSYVTERCEILQL